MNDYIVLIDKSVNKRIQQVGRVEIENGCLFFYSKTDLIAVFSVANIIGFYKD